VSVTPALIKEGIAEGGHKDKFCAALKKESCKGKNKKNLRFTQALRSKGLIHKSFPWVLMPRWAGEEGEQKARKEKQVLIEFSRALNGVKGGKGPCPLYPTMFCKGKKRSTGGCRGGPAICSGI